MSWESLLACLLACLASCCKLHVTSRQLLPMHAFCPCCESSNFAMCFAIKSYTHFPPSALWLRHCFRGCNLWLQGRPVLLCCSSERVPQHACTVQVLHHTVMFLSGEPILGTFCQIHIRYSTLHALLNLCCAQLHILTLEP